MAEKTESEAEAETASTRRGLDPELAAMSKIDRILEEFEESATHRRILVWVVAKYGLPPLPQAQP